jgi:hypothetical protein
MENGHDYRQLVFKMAEASQPEKQSWTQFQETLDTTVLGTLSTSVGVVVLIIGVSGILGFHRAESHNQMLGNTMLGIAAIVGEMLGVAGLTIGRVRNGTISPLAALGTVTCLLQMYLFFGEFMLLHLPG